MNDKSLDAAVALANSILAIGLVPGIVRGPKRWAWALDKAKMLIEHQNRYDKLPAITISHKEGRWHCECPLIPELNASSVTLYALLHAMADRVDMVKEQALTNAHMARAGLERT